MVTHQVWLRNVVYFTQVDHPLHFFEGSVPVRNLCDVVQKVLNLRIDWWHHRSRTRTLSDGVHAESADIPGREPVATEGTLELHRVETSSGFLSSWFSFQ